MALSGQTARRKGLSRREFITIGWWAAAGLVLTEISAGVIYSLWPKDKPKAKVEAFVAGTLDQFKLGEPVLFKKQRLYLSRVPEGVIAFSTKCTHLGCFVPWRADDPSEDEPGKFNTGKGRFNCPCHGSIYTRYGVRVAGPAPRPLDWYNVKLDGSKVVVTIGKPIQRQGVTPDQIVPV
ncbi:MAG: ubiquinol-cytochrome c reductase iron-sulfur subunit [Chloroflexi bacterium]|nr:ubiquinol-cytochrome c reductase iron-sulfur subunit [Chloroflexota bacterium]